MAFKYSVTDEVAEVPVVSPLSASVLERYDDEEYVSGNEVDPVTGEELDVADLIKGLILNTSSPTSTLGATRSMQEETDAHALLTCIEEQIVRQGKCKKSKKNKMVKVDPGMLGFNVTASEDRINVGNIDTV